ncbi:MAG: YkgJ family cysteine cluster protein [Deltaproteobacteria bacterium]|nr:YkgJ family cysteine cluster protein [Deltaproteobacteria bacterium]
MSAHEDASLSEYLALRDKVDAFCAAATKASGDGLRCAPGCDGCCVPGLTLSPVEARVVEFALEALPEGRRGALRERLEDAEGCVLLDAEGRCSVYQARPLVCRTQGLALVYPHGVIPAQAIVHRDAQGRDVSHCPLNFEHQKPGPGATLDADRVDRLLALVNLRFAQDRGVDPGQRVAITTLLAAD